jgi:hypothetical protein
MKEIFGTVFSLSALVTGCTTDPKNISSLYVSPEPYRVYDCQRLEDEFERITDRLERLRFRLYDRSSKETLDILTEGAILWMGVVTDQIILGSSKEEESEYARLKGERNAVREVAVEKGCPDLRIAGHPVAIPSSAPASASGAP